MKFTSEDLLKAMGLKVGQTLKFNHGIFKLVVSNKKNIIVLQSEHKDIGLGILIDEEYEIIQPESTPTEDDYVTIIIDEDTKNAVNKKLNKEYATIAQYWDLTPTLTEDEKNKLKSLDKKWKWIVRDEWEDNIVLFTDKPCKCARHNEMGTWGIPTIGEYTEARNFNQLFKFIKWEDEPYSIEELLKE